MVNTILAMALAGSLAGMLIFAAKWQEERERREAEEQKKADEISRALSLEKDIEMLIDGGKKDVETIQWYACELVNAKSEAEEWKQQAEQNAAYFRACRSGNRALQDKLSAILCPTNNHVWVNGICTKCGREKE